MITIKCIILLFNKFSKCPYKVDQKEICLIPCKELNNYSLSGWKNSYIAKQLSYSNLWNIVWFFPSQPMALSTKYQTIFHAILQNNINIKYWLSMINITVINLSLSCIHDYLKTLKFCILLERIYLHVSS